ncbi:MAG TPA: hypothetical protein VI544_01395 [Candidatus Nanoarchaeia archaeon]|nr:hypothetical protein [Candidatus Nanoarchaeia archaeon]
MIRRIYTALTNYFCRKEAQPGDETQEIPYDPTKRETQAIPVRGTDSQLLIKIARSFNLEAEVDEELRESGVFLAEFEGLYAIDSRDEIKPQRTPIA